MVVSQILLDSAESRNVGTPCEANRILLASALSSMCAMCPNRVSRDDWIIAVSLLGCFVSLRTSSFQTNWYHLMPSSISRHHRSSASNPSILRVSVFDIIQQFKPYRNIGKMCVGHRCHRDGYTLGRHHIFLVPCLP